MEEQLEGLKASTIMIVDDESTTVEILQAFLEGEGYSQFIGLTDSRQTLPTLAREAPDVLLLDLHMPEVGGFEILKTIRADEKLRPTPVIILTAATDSETKLEALELGATDFLSKPVDPSELALRLRNTLAAKAYQDRLTYYDAVTGLPNQRLFFERTERALRRGTARGAVLHLHLDAFDRVNDTLGYQVGEALLRAVARRLMECVKSFAAASPLPASPLLARMGGDEFALFVPGLTSGDDVRGFAQRLLDELAKPYRSKTRDLYFPTRVGIALFPEHGRQVETLLRNARLCNARRSAPNSYSFFDASLNAESLRRLKLETDLRGAAERRELLLHYQPKVDTSCNEVVGVEALMRWRHPELGMIPPAEFVPIADELGIAPDLGRRAIRQACHQAKAWQKAGFPPLIMSVNISHEQLQHGDLAETLCAALTESGLDPAFLLLELTEATLMMDPDATAHMLGRIAEMNLSVSIDNFGTGYSALSHLKQFPVDELKIDRSFVAPLPDNEDSAAIIKAIVAMAHSLGLGVAAEGVETEAQLNLLRQLGCDQYQGYVFAEPLPADRIPVLLRAQLDQI